MLDYNFQYWPSGFRSPLQDGVKNEILPHPDVVKLMQQYRTGEADVLSLTTQLELIRLANLLFGKFSEFVTANDQNTRISQQGYEFLVDTIEFIRTGHRSVSIASRTGVMATEARIGQYDNPKAAVRKERLKDLLDFVHDRDVVWCWLKHRNGIVDLLSTVNVLFAAELRS